jgi:trimethyllysine dioxygenase
MFTGGFYDFTSDLTMKDTAYTNLALAAHTDTAYFSEPAGLQMFHLLSHTEGSGGKSLLVDGFKAAEMLREEDRDSFDILRQKPLTWHSSGNKGITITTPRPIPMFNTFSNGVNKQVFQVRWNNDDRAVLPLGRNFEKVKTWYDAARKFNRIIQRNGTEYWAQLEPGRPLSTPPILIPQEKC